MKIKPLGNRVVVEPLSKEEKTQSGIILPDTVDKEKPEQGKIIAVGAGKKIQESGVKKGDTVLFGKYGGDDIKFDNKEYKVLKEEEIFAILE
ncbi:MAG: co-chaperone GroES [Parcubacteria group bacterium GW2011_GWA2_38_13b]|nr:MAG: co-chaperone GroES [Parcubacteria group bacterium GW2011_GWA2_38_13b]